MLPRARLKAWPRVAGTGVLTWQHGLMRKRGKKGRIMHVQTRKDWTIVWVTFLRCHHLGSLRRFSWLSLRREEEESGVFLQPHAKTSQV
ncbi:unnamed protein product [Protopolystoma xenopodis]|uniref:Uncharacterized protein n=1 Tax=Protopolystoma xenopodis TaxID=117903 RepID=A0A448X4X5_9PLAT|nr:unnamed protein product [Protopolystoma xenopodis]